MPGKLIPFEKVRAARRVKPGDDVQVRVRRFKTDSWFYPKLQDSVQAARETAMKFDPNPEWIITVNGVEVEHRKPRKGAMVNKPGNGVTGSRAVLVTGSAWVGQGGRYERATGYSGGLDHAPINAPDNHTLRKNRKGGMQRVSKPRPPMSPKPRGPASDFLIEAEFDARARKAALAAEARDRRKGAEKPSLEVGD